MSLGRSGYCDHVIICPLREEKKPAQTATTTTTTTPWYIHTTQTLVIFFFLTGSRSRCWGLLALGCHGPRSHLAIFFFRIHNSPLSCGISRVLICLPVESSRGERTEHSMASTTRAVQLPSKEKSSLGMNARNRLSRVDHLFLASSKHASPVERQESGGRLA